MIEISGHHLKRELDASRCVGYDEVHDWFRFTIAHRIFVTADPETRVKVLIGPDKSCALCPRNKKGERFDRRYLRRSKREPCDPNGEQVRAVDERAIYNLERVLGRSRSEITAGDLQRCRERRGQPFLEFYDQEELERLLLGMRIVAAKKPEDEYN